MYTHHNTSRGSDCAPCSKCHQPSCECQCNVPSYEDVGCLSQESTDCSYYSQDDLTCLNVTKGLSLTQVLKRIGNYLLGIFGKISSSTLSLKRTGPCNDNLTIDLMPSHDANNALTLGTDGRPFVGQSQVELLPIDWLSWQKIVQGNKITFVPVVNINILSQKICPLCDNPVPCNAPTGVMTLATAQNSIQISWNQIAGVNYDILVNGALHQANVLSPYTINGLSPNTTYSIAVRAKCSSGQADATISVTTIPVTSCTNPSSLTITLS